MLPGIYKYLYHFLQRKTMVLLSLMIFSIGGYSQNRLQQQDSSLSQRFSPLFVSAHKKTLQIYISHGFPPYNKTFVLRKVNNELIYLANYPLNAALIAARDRRYDRPLGKQIADDIAASIITNLIYGSKTPVAVRPKF